MGVVPINCARVSFLSDQHTSRQSINNSNLASITLYIVDQNSSVTEGVFIQRNGTMEWNGGMEWNSGMTTPTELVP